MIWKTDDKNLKRLHAFDAKQMLAHGNGSKIVKIPKTRRPNLTCAVREGPSTAAPSTEEAGNR